MSGTKTSESYIKEVEVEHDTPARLAETRTQRRELGGQGRALHYWDKIVYPVLRVLYGLTKLFVFTSVAMMIFNGVLDFFSAENLNNIKNDFVNSVTGDVSKQLDSKFGDLKKDLQSPKS